VNRRDGGGQLTFDQLYEQLWWPMLRMAVGLVDDVGVAEDVVQDAFAAVHRRWDFIRSNQALVSYLRTAVVNGARSTLRRRGTARKHLHLVSDQTDQPSDHRLMLSEEHRAVRAAFAQLPERQRTVLTLRYISELSDAEIATATGLSTGGVRSAASRGLSSLRASLGGLQ
jgi:RNA polymerase sigma-70 factor (sigma-E family)